MTITAKRNLFFACVSLAVMFLLVELTLRLVFHLSVDYLSRKDDVNYEYKLWQMHLFDSFMGMQESDPDLFWRLRPDYRSSFIYVNHDGFSGPEIHPKQANELRILFLGDSTPLGLGLPKTIGSFVWQARALLQESFPDRQVVVINGSVAGYTSWQCSKLLELRGENLKPDWVITYFGNNDPSYNGLLSDKQLSQLSQRSGWLNRLLANSYGYQLLKNAVLRIKESAPVAGEVKERVSVSEFTENLEAIRSWCDGHNCKLAVCSVPTPNLWPPGIQFKVFASGKDSDGRLVMADGMQRELNSLWELCLDTLLLPGAYDQWTSRVLASSSLDTLPPAQAEMICRSQLARNHDDARLMNNLGVSLWRQGRDSLACFYSALAHDSLNPTVWFNLGICLYRSDPAEADGYLQQAKELDHNSLRIKSGYNRALREFCSRNGAVLIDLENIFSGLPDSEYFVDHCHPTAKGHALIARRIATAVTRVYRQDDTLAPR